MTSYLAQWSVGFTAPFYAAQTVTDHSISAFPEKSIAARRAAIKKPSPFKGEGVIHEVNDG